MFRNIGATEIIIVAVVLLIIFGPKKLPEFAKGIAEAIKEFKSTLEGKEKKQDKEEKSE